MYSTLLPIHPNENTNRQELLEILSQAHAEYAILSLDNVILSAGREVYEKQISAVAEMIPFLKSHGYKVGVFLWSLWLKDIEPSILEKEVMISSSGRPRVRMTALNSAKPQYSGYLCPTSQKTDIMLDVIRHVASYSPDLILLNDDLGYSTYLSGIGCYCERHLSLVEKRLGRRFSREELRSEIFSGKRNAVRDAWLDVQGASIEGYAMRIREAIDEVDSSIRCGFCSVMSNWSADGTSAERIARLMAGKTRPLIRLIGAPYWAASMAWGNRLQHTVELTRMESSFVCGEDVELIAEGDVYPRPRHKVPAAFLEHYDTALRAAGCCDGIFKFMLDYTASPHYERGYTERHIRNLPIYSEIERVFSDKECVGVRVYERMNKANDSDFTDVKEPEKYAELLFFSYGSRFLADNSIPTVYESESSVGLAFGENARSLPSEARGSALILDVRAARILMEEGVDIGIERIGDFIHPDTLYFPEDNEKIPANYRQGSAREIIPRSSARVSTYSLVGDVRYADAIEYENANGQRFLVYAFDAAMTDEGRYRNYCTQNQLARSLAWLSSKPFPVFCLGNPDLYMICKQNEGGMAIGMWNMFADGILHPEILLGEKYRDAEFINCSGTLHRDNVTLYELPPYSFAFINLKK